MHRGKIVIINQPVSMFPLAASEGRCPHSILRRRQTTSDDIRSSAQAHASVTEKRYLTDDNKRCREALLDQIGADCRASDLCVDDSSQVDRKDTKANQTDLIVFDGRNKEICQKSYMRQILSLSRKSARIQSLYAVLIVPRMSNGELCLNKSNTSILTDIVRAGAGEQECVSTLFVSASCVLWRSQLEELVPHEGTTVMCSVL